MAKAKHKTSKLKLLWAIPMLSAYVAWGMVSDLNFHSRDFMLTHTKVEKKEVDDSTRHVASGEKSGPSVLYFPLNPDNYQKISGSWNVYNFINTKDQDEPINANVKLELIGNGQVELDQDHKQIFYISFLSDQDTIAIFKKLPNGYEILEARKIKPHSNFKEESHLAFDSGKVDSTKVDKKGISMVDAELVLEKALLPNVTNVVIEGDAISGKATIREGALQHLDVRVSANNQTYNVSIPFAEINDGGQFTAELEGSTISGILTNNGQTAYRIRFATGPLAGAILNFLSEEEFEKLQDFKADVPTSQPQENESGESRVNSAQEMVQNKIEEQKKAVDERQEKNEEVNENEAPNVENTTPEELAQKIQESGFDFGVPKQREIASEQ